MKSPGIRLSATAGAAALAISALSLTAGSARPVQQRGAIVEAVRSFRTDQGWRILHELREWLSLPNNSADDADIRRNAEHLSGMLQRRGIRTRLLEAPGSPPVVFGSLESPGAEHTIVFYAHYDGQPTDPGEWSSPPFEPLLRSGPREAGGEPLAWLPADSAGPLPGREARLYARSSSDDKSPIVALMAALDALRAGGIHPSVNLKLFFEGEEEAGSPHMREMLTRHRDLLDADLWVFCDGPVHQSRVMQAVFGVRGVVGVNLTVYGPRDPLHSGHYGNWVPNPAARLSNLIASLRDDTGRITIDGFYEDVRPITDADREALREVPRVEDRLLTEFGIAAPEQDRLYLMEAIMRPALNVDGLRAGGVGTLSRNAIPSEAHAYLDFRLVPDQTPERVRVLAEAHARALGWLVLDRAPTEIERGAHAKIVRMAWSAGYPAVRTDMDLPASQAVVRSAGAIGGVPLLRIPSLGGSLPLHTFVQALGGPPLVILPMVNHDNNQHASDENLRLANLWDGIDMYAGVIALTGRYWYR